MPIFQECSEDLDATVISSELHGLREKYFELLDRARTMDSLVSRLQRENAALRADGANAIEEDDDEECVHASQGAMMARTKSVQEEVANVDVVR